MQAQATLIFDVKILLKPLAYPTFAAPLKAKGANARRAVELAKFNLECEPHGQKCGTGETSGTSGTGETGGTGGTGRRIIRLFFAYRSLILRSLFTHRLLFLYCSLYIVLFVFLIFTSSKFFILLSDFDCISIC